MRSILTSGNDAVQPDTPAASVRDGGPGPRADLIPERDEGYKEHA
jgi:hypothetical protein